MPFSESQFSERVAQEYELTFILLGRDPVASETIRFWADRRVSRGLNSWEDPKIQEALRLADEILMDQNL